MAPTNKPKIVKPIPKKMDISKPAVKKKIKHVSKAKAHKVKFLDKITSKPLFKQSYLVGSVVILISSVIFWAILGAHLQQNNADQLSDAYLFKNAATFHGAVFPAAHTFFLKWPLFLLIQVLGYSTAAFIGVTVGLVLATILVLLAVLYRIDKRPLVFGTICLALASVLLLIPAQPYAGGILPVNMAMLTTRNIEYAVYIISLILFVRSRSIKKWQFWVSTVVLSVLIASDKLFLATSLGAAVLGLIVYSLVKRWEYVSLAVNWLISIVLAAAGSALIIEIINSSGFTHITGGNGLSPYGVVHNLSNFGLGLIYAFLGLFTNFGANPAFSGTEIKAIPHDGISQIFSIGGFSYLVNIVILVIGSYLVIRLILNSLKTKSHRTKPDNHLNLALMLIWTSIVTVGLFIVSSHYYAVDSRYLTIVLFTFFISAAVIIRKINWKPDRYVLFGVLALISIALGVPAAAKISNNQNQAFSQIKQRDANILAIQKIHSTDVLVGDYWRVLPLKQDSGGNLNVIPLGNCATPLSTLNSSSWQVNLHDHSFTYLLSSDQDLTNYPHCSLNQVIGAYGRPNASTLVAGQLSAPKEQLLFYDKGIHNSAPKTSSTTKSPETVVPVSLSQLPYTSCPVPTVLAIVAHEDDDLLFMNPDILNDIKAGDCVRTTYLTAGNAGAGEFYWLSRERGVEAAYSAMLGTPNTIWVERLAEITTNEYATVANPRGNSKITLIFMLLPDGNLKGNGFPGSGFQSLAKLYSGQIRLISSVDDQSRYSASQLVSALTSLMTTYSPTEIYTQSTFLGTKFPDHSDHVAVSEFAKQAYTQYESEQYSNEVKIPIYYYMGYPGRQFPANVSGNELTAKENIFLTYAKYDGGVCQNVTTCLSTPSYNGYLLREYQNSY